MLLHARPQLFRQHVGHPAQSIRSYSDRHWPDVPDCAGTGARAALSCGSRRVFELPPARSPLALQSTGLGTRPAPRPSALTPGRDVIHRIGMSDAVKPSQNITPIAAAQ
jgi:hypothetical protein